MATSSTKSNISFIMQEAILKGYFDAVVCGSDVIRGKPSPDIFLKAAKKIKTAPRSCVVIEDSNHGLLAASRAGMKSIGVATSMKSSSLKHTNNIVKKTGEITPFMIRVILENG
jgi:beta-phosphoglucomutase-like phosphatase (HAD superfamily)